MTMRLGCLGVLFTVGFLVCGGQFLYVAARNRAPATLTAKAYLDHRPNSEWVHLTQAHVDLAECASISRGSRIEDLYIPVRALGQDRNEPVQILLKTKNPELIDLMAKVAATKGDMAQMARLVRENPVLLHGPGDVTGVVQIGIAFDSKTRGKLEGLKMNLTSDYVIIADGASPSLMTGLGFIAAGLVLGGFMLSQARKRAAAPVAPAAVNGPNLPPRDFGGPPPPPLPPRF